jgi:hypothetical protein
LIQKHIIPLVNGVKVKWCSDRYGGFFYGESIRKANLLACMRRSVDNDNLGIIIFTISNPVLELQNGNSSSAVGIAADVQSSNSDVVMEPSNSDDVKDTTDLTNVVINETEDFNVQPESLYNEFADITSLEPSNSNVVMDATDVTDHEQKNVITLVYSVQQWKLMFTIINIKPDGYCGYRVLFILIRYGKQPLHQIGRRKSDLKDITDSDFFDNEEIRIMFLTCLERLNTTNFLCKDSYIREVSQVLK